MSAALNLSTYIGDKATDVDADAMSQTPMTHGPRHAPLPHAIFYNAISDQFSVLGIGLAQTRHALLNKGQVYFGIAELVGQAQHFVPVVAWRSSHNQRVAASLYVGAGVRELNNVCLTTEVRVASRQTLNFAERLPDLVHDALSEVSTIAHQQRSTFQRLIDTKLSDEDAERAIIEMIRMDIVSPSKSGLVIEQWDSPENEALAAKRNVWRLYNAVAGSYKPIGATDAVNALIERSPRLMSFCKAMVLERL